MSSALYTTDILRLALGAAAYPRLVAPHGSSDERTPVCGSRIVMDVALGPDGRIASVGMDVHACAMGQASAGLFAASARGCDRGDVLIARNGLAEWLAGARAVPPGWPGIEALVAARAYPARHAAILLPFNAASQAMATARRSAFPEPVEGLSFSSSEGKGSPSTSSGWSGLKANDLDATS